MSRIYKWSTIFIVFLIIFSSSAGVSAQPFGKQASTVQAGAQQKVLHAQSGRFVFGQISKSDKDQFMLDTLTGRLWRMAERGDIGKHLISVPYCNSKGECTDLPNNPRETVSKQK